MSEEKRIILDSLATLIVILVVVLIWAYNSLIVQRTKEEQLEIEKNKKEAEEKDSLLFHIKTLGQLVPAYEAEYKKVEDNDIMLSVVGFDKNKYIELREQYTKNSQSNNTDIDFLKQRLINIKAILDEIKKILSITEEQVREYWRIKIREATKEVFRKNSFIPEHEAIKPKKTEQQILDEYENKSFLKPEEIGARYERYIGYLYEIDGYKVQYNGIVMGKKDDGIDIIASKRNELIIIQCKWYKEDSQIHSNTIRQLSDNLNDWTEDNPNKKVKARLYTVYDNLDEQARTKLARTQIEHRVVAYDNDYPKIKCNINDDTKEKIYHLPGVGQYDRIKINIRQGESYAKSIEEAKELGFRSVNYRDFSDIETDLDENFYNFIIDYKKLKYGCSIYKKDLSEDDFEMYSIMIGGV